MWHEWGFTEHRRVAPLGERSGGSDGRQCLREARALYLSPGNPLPPHSPCGPLGQHLKGQLAGKSRKNDESTRPGPGKEASAWGALPAASHQLETAGQRLTCARRWPGVVLPEFYVTSVEPDWRPRPLQARFSSVHRCSHCSCILASSDSEQR